MARLLPVLAWPSAERSKERDWDGGDYREL
jgi:hypothetical protein